MNWQRVVLGIGNPGAEYEGTRHNVGFMVLDRVAERLGLTFSRLERKAPDGTRRFGGKVKARSTRAPGGAEEKWMPVVEQPASSASSAERTASARGWGL